MDAQSENNLLKRKHYETNQKDINLKEKVENFSTSSVHALKKPLYSSFFINNKQVDKQANLNQNRKGRTVTADICEGLNIIKQVEQDFKDEPITQNRNRNFQMSTKPPAQHNQTMNEFDKKVDCLERKLESFQRIYETFQETYAKDRNETALAISSIKNSYEILNKEISTVTNTTESTDQLLRGFIEDFRNINSQRSQRPNQEYNYYDPDHGFYHNAQVTQ